MQPASYTIAVDPDRDLVHVRMTGFFTIADVDRFQGELQLAHRQLRCALRGGPLTINDISGMAIQSQDVIRHWAGFLADPAHRSRRLAFVVSSALARLQLQTVIVGRDSRIFATHDEAEQWLFDGSAAAA
ncbi:MAG: hypothetical protein PGN21_08380 [Sphingomonas paucimobilis]